MSTQPTDSPSYIGKFHSALDSVPLDNVDLETLQHLEQSHEFDHYLDPAAPKILFALVQTHMKRHPGSTVRERIT